MIIKVNRICSNGSMVNCFLPSENIQAVEVSERDGKTTIIRTKYGCVAVADSCNDVLTAWATAANLRIMEDNK